LRAYTLKEVSKKINLAPGTIRQWEKDLNDLLDIPRSKQGARIYSDAEIEQLLEIKQMYGKKFSKEKIRQWLQKKLESENQEITEASPNSIGITEASADSFGNTKTAANSLEVITETVPPAEVSDHQQNTQLFFEAMDTYKKNFLNEVKEEIRSVVRKEVLDEVKKEISKGSLLTVKTLSDSIYKSTATTKAEIEELTETFEKASELTADKLQYLANNIKYASLDTSDEILTLSKQLIDTSEEISHYIDLTNNEISQLAEVISKDREMLIEEREELREELRHEISQREAAFQQMLTNFRDAAAAKGKSWWKFWA
jgi:DNA-binding transcriptional MerR regulator